MSRDGSTRVGRRRDLHRFGQCHEFIRLLQAPRSANARGELRCPQRLADPNPGRDIMAQAWYQGGISVFDWTDPAHPREIAFFDRGPADTTLKLSGSWSAYWYNGVIVSSEITRGLDIFELTPSSFISQNEIDAAKTVRFDYYNTQGQQQFVWPASFALARAYVDQLERSGGLAAGRISAVRQALATAEGGREPD